jgi:outer membrane protein assembly factor BamB
MKAKTLSIFVLLLCGCLLLTGCLGSTTPKGWSGPVADNGTLYVGSMTGKVVAFDDIGAEGKHYMQWIYPDDTAISYVYGDPVVDNGSVYITCYNGKVYVVNASHGYSEWKYPSDSNSYVGAIVGSPTVVDGYLYFGSSDKYLYAVDTVTKQLKWKKETGGKIWSTPVVYNGTVYIGSFDKKLYAFDALTGVSKWTAPFEAGGAIVSTPTVYNGTLYFGSLDRKIYAVDVDTGKLKDGFKPFEAGNWFWSKAVVYNGNIIDCSLDGGVYAIDAGTGAELWNAKVNGSIRGNPALVNNVLVVGTDEGNSRGKAYGLDLDNRGKEIWEYPRAEESMYSIHASVGVDGDIVYIHTTNQQIFAIEASSGNMLWSVSTGGSQ